MRLIDADLILNDNNQFYYYLSDEWVVRVRDIENAETVDANVQEVRRGRWVYRQLPMPLSDGSKECVECSVCYTHWEGETNYCPNCGAKMDEEG